MGRLTAAIQGCVIEFVGDAILAVFGVPHSMADHAEQALRCGIAMQHRQKELNAEWRKSSMARTWEESGIIELSTRIGIHSGPVVAGNLGSQTRMKYSVIGDSVNVAARLEMLNKELGTDILNSRDVYLQLPVDLVDGAVERDIHKVKSREHPVRVYAVSGPPATIAAVAVDR
jgi:adenylate cyclase